MAIRKKLNALLSESYQNEVELLQLALVIHISLKNLSYSVFGHQKEAELLCLVIVIRMSLNCFSFQ